MVEKGKKERKEAGRVGGREGGREGGKKLSPELNLIRRKRKGKNENTEFLEGCGP